MKKTLLTFLFTAPFLLFAQSPAKEVKVKTSHAEKINLSATQAIDVKVPEGTSKGSDSYTPKNKKAKLYTYTVLGETYYDLQTNASIGRRIVLHSDGTISATWTASEDDGTNWPNRGTGYNHNDGNGWMTGRDGRIEASTRTGWPSLSVLEDGSELVMGHESNTGGFVVSKNGSKGSTSFTTAAAILDDVSELNVNRVPIWNRSAASNGKLHVISNYWFSEDNNVPQVTRAGVTSPTTYSRWNLSGDTAEVEHMLLPGYDSTLYANGGGDNYAIDVRDSVVAIVMGGLGEALSLWKSMDNGETWTYTDVDGYAYKAVLTDSLIPDTPATNDGSVEVILDGNDIAHVFYGGAEVLDTDLSDESFSFFPGTARLMHWKEGDSEPKIAGGVIDMDGDQTLTIAQETFSALDAGNIPNNLLSASRTGNTSLATMPSASIDADGNLYVVYSAPIENALHFLNSNFRDIMVSYSTDGGDTWNGPQNITQDRTEECNFPCAAKMADNFLHVMWQQDATPGTHLQNHSAAAGSHPNDIQRIHYAAIPVTDILGDVIGQNTLNTPEIDRAANVFVVSQNQPNPFNGTAEVLVYLRAASDVNLTVTDVLGNVVNQGTLGVMGAGNHTVTIDANGLSSGMYFYTLSTKDHSVTKKMQVK